MFGRSSKSVLKNKKRKNLELMVKSFDQGEEVVSHYPIVWYLEASSVCNLRCPMCPVTMGFSEYQYSLKYISIELVDKILEPLSYAKRCLLSGGGEPLLHPDFFRLIKKVKELELEVIFNTNGTLIKNDEAKWLVELGVDCISISVDGTTEEGYSRIRKGGRLEDVLSAFFHLNRWKQELKSEKPYLNMQFTLLKDNYKELEGVIRFVSGLRLNHLVIEPLTPIFKFNEKYKKYYEKNKVDKNKELICLLNELKEEARNYNIIFSSHYLEERRELKKCVQPWLNFGVRVDGRVFLCCGTPEFMGTLSKESFEDIWNGENYRRFRKEIARNSYPASCNLCLEEMRAPFFNRELMEGS